MDEEVIVIDMDVIDDLDEILCIDADEIEVQLQVLEIVTLDVEEDDEMLYDDSTD